MVRVTTTQLTIVLTVIGYGFGPAVRAQDKEGSYHYRYFDQTVPLDCDVSTLAVFENASVPNPKQAVLDGVSAAGAEATSVSESGVPAMWTVQVPESKRNGAGVRSFIRSLASRDGVGIVSPILRDANGDPVMITSHIHVGFEAGVAPERINALLAEFGSTHIEQRDWAGMPGVYRVRCDSRDGFDVLEIANKLAASDGVRFAEPDLIMTVHKSLIPNDTFFSLLWGLHNTGQSGGTVDMDMDGPEAWDITIGDANVVIAILDDGTQQNHPDINQIPGADFTGSGTGGGPLNQCDNHGTAVAGCTSAIINNGLGVVGSAPGCKVAAGKWSIANVGNPCPGTGSFQISWFVNALDWAQSIGAKVTNNSNGFGPSGAITTKYQTTRDAGLVHFAASGNSGAGVIGYPANLPTVNAVGAIDRFGNRASFSQFGTGLAFVAPGVSVATTDRTGAAGYVSGDYVSTNGTSFSSPYAAGVAGLVFSVNDSLSPDDVEQIINSTSMDLGASGYDTFFGWGLVNLHDAAQAALPTTLTLSGACYYDVGMTQPVDPVTVEVINLDSGVTFQADTAGNQYTLDLDTTSEVSEGDTLRYIAKDDDHYINVTDQTVSSNDINAGSLVLDLVLDEFYLDLVDFPQYEADAPDYSEFTGPAVAQMVLNYIWWNSTQDPTPPLTFPDQGTLYTYGLSQNATPGLTVFDPIGMRATIQNNRPLPYSQFGYNFSLRQDTDSAAILKQIAQWVAYEIGTFGGLEPGHPLHVPGVIPAYGDYSNWIAVRGIHTSEDAYPLPDPLDVFGFWINDPLPAAFGGIGENSYKTADELLNTYYLPLATGDAYDGKYVAICEPPDEVDDSELRLINSPPRFGTDAVTDVQRLRSIDGNAPADLVSDVNAWVVDAAIEGASEQLVPYDPNFARRLASSRPGTPLLVRSELGPDYFAVPFEQSPNAALTSNSDASTVAVVLVSAEDGCFLEASWVSDPVEYPRLSKKRAMSIAFDFLLEQGIKPENNMEDARVDLVYLASTPYHPHWRIRGENYEVLVDQSGLPQLN